MGTWFSSFIHNHIHNLDMAFSFNFSGDDIDVASDPNDAVTSQENIQGVLRDGRGSADATQVEVKQHELKQLVSEALSPFAKVVSVGTYSINDTNH